MADFALRAFERWTSSLSFERHYPWVLALLMGAGSLYSGWVAGADLPLLLGATVAFGSIIAGFVGTSLSILTSLGSAVMNRIRATRYIQVVRDYLGQGLGSGILVAFVGMAGLAFTLYGQAWFTALWVTAVVYCAACLYRLARTMLRIFVDPENHP